MLATEAANTREPEVAPRWQVDAVEALLGQPFSELIYRAQGVHREHFDPSEIQLSTLLSIKTGGCPEDCAYCPQSVRYETGVVDADLMPADDVVAAARAAKKNGATRFCMGAAWRGPKQRDLDQVVELVRAVKGLGLETCATLGMLKPGQAEALKAAGLDYYNHNLDTSPDFYGEIVRTRTYDDRLATLDRVRAAGIHVCCGGIVGMGESRRQRAEFLAQLANLDPHPESVPINNLVQVEGTPLERCRSAWIHWNSCAPSRPRESPCRTAYVRLSAGARGDARSRAGALLPGRRELHLLRRQVAHHRQSGRDAGSGAVRKARPAPDPLTRCRGAGAVAQPMQLPDLVAGLDTLEASRLRRHRRTRNGMLGPRVEVDGRELLCFGSNDYLGLASDPRLIAAACAGAQASGVGAGASHLVCGHHADHETLERRLAEFVGMPRALLFSTGYMAALGVVTALLDHRGAVFADRLNHACLNDAVLLARARFHRYPHGDLDALDRALSKSSAPRKIVVSDAVFSMDGDIAAVPDLLTLCERYGAWLLLDDAHGFGVLGHGGRGGVVPFRAAFSAPDLHGDTGQGGRSVRRVRGDRRGDRRRPRATGANLYLYDCVAATPRARSIGVAGYHRR